MKKLYKVSATTKDDNSSVVHFFRQERWAISKYNHLKGLFTVKNVRIVLVEDRGQKTEQEA